MWQLHISMTATLFKTNFYVARQSFVGTFLGLLSFWDTLYTTITFTYRVVCMETQAGDGTSPSHHNFFTNICLLNCSYHCMVLQRKYRVAGAQTC